MQGPVLEDELVWVAGGPRRARPRAEARVPHEPQSLPGHITGDYVRAGAWERVAAGRPAGRRAGNPERLRQSQLVEKLGVRLAQVEGDGAGLRVGDDAFGKVAVRRPARARRGTL